MSKQTKEQTKHELPETLKKRLQNERESARRQVEQINTVYQQVVSNIASGYAASLDPDKRYILDPDLEYLIEDNGGSKEDPR